MRRREFTLSVFVTALVWGAEAAEAPTERVLGILFGRPPGDKLAESQIAIVRSVLSEKGWPASSVRLVVEWSEQTPAAMSDAATRLTNAHPDAILCVGTIAAEALKSATQTIPVVFVGATDPVNSGLVESLTHPNGNLTGFTNLEISVAGKWIELVRDLAPNSRIIEVLAQPDNAGIAGLLQSIESASKSSQVEIHTNYVRTRKDIETKLDQLSGKKRALMVVPAGLVSANVDIIHGWELTERAVVVYPSDFYVKSGGLVSYGPNEAVLYYDAAIYISRILRGESTAQLPVQTPRAYRLIVSKATADRSGIHIPEDLLARADEVIE